MTNIDPNREALSKAHAKWNSHREMFDFPSTQTGFEAGWKSALAHAASEIAALRAQNEIYKSYLSGMASDPFKKPEQYWQYANEALTNAKQLGKE